MKFEHYVKRVEESPEFKKFRGEHKKAYLCAGFFVLDFEKGRHLQQIDFLIPGSKKIATFNLEDGIKLKLSDSVKMKKKLEKIDSETMTDIDALKGIVHDEMLNRTVTGDIKKIIAVLQTQEGRKVWNLSCITGDMGILKVHVDDSSSSVLEFEKASLFDFVKMIPKDKLPPGTPGAPGTNQGLPPK
jgi:hypothetical protein